MEQEMNQDLFSDFPSHIAIEIFSKLSTKTISRCCCVCKQWQALALSLELANSRQTRTRPALMVYTTSNRELLTTVELEDEPTSHDMYSLHGFSFADLTEGLALYKTSMLASINGLLCFYEFGYNNPDRILVLNPVTMEIITLPSTGGVMEFPHVTSYGFGVTSDIFKVVKIYQEKDEDMRITKSECYVYTLGHGCWRLLQQPAPFEYSCRSHGVFFNGYIHWLVHDQDLNGTKSEMISCFDMEKESFSEFPAPHDWKKDGWSTLGVYKGGFLSLCINSSDYEITVWVMEEYGVKESWVKKFSIDKEVAGEACERQTTISILRVFEDGVVLLLWGDNSFYYYNFETKFLEKLDIQNFPRRPEECVDVADFVPSFVSLKRFGREIVQVGPIVGNV